MEFHTLFNLFCKRIVAIAGLMFLFAAFPTFAQESNVLGLPPIPQPKPGAAGALPSNPSAKAPTPAGARTTRDAITGEMGLQHSALNGTGRLIATTRATFTTAGARGTAIETALLVQRELSQACGKQCKPLKMPPPKILSTGQLEFELAFAPLHQHLTQAQFLAALQGKPLNLSPEQLTAPAATSASPTTMPTATVTAK